MPDPPQQHGNAAIRLGDKFHPFMIPILIHGNLQFDPCICEKMLRLIFSDSRVILWCDFFFYHIILLDTENSFLLFSGTEAPADGSIDWEKLVKFNSGE